MTNGNHAAVAVLEGMDEFELVVEDATGDERVFRRVSEPGQKTGDQGGHAVGGRREVDDCRAALDTDTAGAETPRLVDQTGHDDAVCGQQVVA
mgnify:CR=1 FL=1